jgi:chemotaxis signal transduction protein
VGGLVVRVGGEWLWIPLDVVHEVLDAPAATPVPGGPPALVGIAAVRGRIVPVWRADALLGIAGGPDPARCVRLGVDGVGFALLVDAVEGLLRPAEVHGGDGAWWAAGTAQTAGDDPRVLSVLAPDAVLARVSR